MFVFVVAVAAVVDLDVGHSKDYAVAVVVVVAAAAAAAAGFDVVVIVIAVGFVKGLKEQLNHQIILFVQEGKRTLPFDVVTVVFAFGPDDEVVPVAVVADDDDRDVVLVANVVPDVPCVDVPVGKSE
ncbi:unnamed protein product [[Candida] boidinii]|uniref:Unnamed protein product n=1 Tax=Candida boidinii TaxID=5477 RepID=A0A9W6WKJ0_CANBO|nr:unnamed protein product [[Candida] boidinii]